MGKPYTVWVEVQNLYPEPYTGGWNLFVCWGIPFTGTLPSVNIGQILNGSVTSAGPQGAPITGTIPAATMSSPGIAVLQAAMTWTPSLENGGHECLLAAVYDEQDIGGLATSTLLDGDAPWTQIDSVAQRNFSVVQSTGVCIISRIFSRSGITPTKSAISLSRRGRGRSKGSKRSFPASKGGKPCMRG